MEISVTGQADGGVGAVGAVAGCTSDASGSGEVVATLALHTGSAVSAVKTASDGTGLADCVVSFEVISELAAFTLGVVAAGGAE